jgi:hypothetical protein
MYTVRADDGATQRYVAGADDGSLPRDIPLGARITKRKWELSFILNGTRVLNFPIVFYAIALTGSLISLISGVLLLMRRSR